MKINNKGFAFSTMLYGVLSLIIIVLTLIFTILNRTNNETYYYSSTVEDTLNKCVTEEVALENCYTSNSKNCDTTAYYACLGITNNNTTTAIKAYDFLLEKITTSSDGIYLTDNNNLVFKGIDVNNYIQFSGDVWRIIKIEASGTLKLAYTKYGKSLKWDVNGSGEWKGSSLENELNNTFYSTLNNNSLIDKKNWNIGRIYDITKTVEELKEQEELVKYTNNNIFVGLPNASDYIEASLNSSCSTDVLNSTSCNSWLSSYDTWLINSSYTDNDLENAYYFNAGNKLLKKQVTEEEKVIPVIYLKASLKISGGDGTISNPYIIER